METLPWICGHCGNFNRFHVIEQQAFLYRCIEVRIRLRRGATDMESCESIITAAFNERHSLHQIFNNPPPRTLEARERLLILMKEADVDRMGQEDIACMMMLNCFIDTTLKAKLGADKNPNGD